jgi:hypothetical protein
LNTRSPGTLAYTVTATSLDGQTGTATIHYTVTVPLGIPVNQVRPVASGTATPGHALSCTTGTWSNAPSIYGYQWLRNGNLIAGASRPSYTVAAGDEGSSLACDVVAANSTGVGAAAMSNGIAVPIVATSGCPAATGTIHGTHLGPVTFGITRATAQRDFPRSARRGKLYEQFFCLTPRRDPRRVRLAATARATRREGSLPVSQPGRARVDFQPDLCDRRNPTG